ncbi:MAG: HAD-IIIA family hydrolase [bacterium]|nr:HAD-IIIA family hydrolase [bacterium]MDI1334726.1 HAD-IIIA family hydrolase [Lacunisphaera sp.]
MPQTPRLPIQKNRRPAVFLDRDGTLNASVVRDGLPYAPASVAEFQLLPGVAESCQKLHAAGYVLVVATNQPDVGRGTQTQAAVEAIDDALRALVPEIARIEVCYDPGRGEPSPRRKPAPGMLLDAAAALDLDLGRSWMIGDRWRDIDAGHAAGCRTVFIDWHYAEALRQTPDFTVRSFAEAAGIILARP